MDNHPADIFLTFVDVVNGQTLGRLFNNLAGAVNRGFQRIHLLIQSSGGNLDDGIAAHNVLAHLPVECITYNSGTIRSAAILLFLAGHNRVVADTGSFLFHTCAREIKMRGTATAMRAEAEIAEKDDDRANLIYKRFITKMPDEWWQKSTQGDVIITPDESIENGMATMKGHFEPLRGCELFNI